MTKFRRVLIAASFFLSFGVFSGDANDVPVFNYKVEIGPEGEIIVKKSGSNLDGLVIKNNENDQLNTGEEYWVVINPAKGVVDVTPAGTAGVIAKLGIGDTLQVVPSYQAQNASWFSRPTLEEMEKNIKMQVRSAAKAFMEEVCDLMHNWDVVKFSFEVGADAFVVAKIKAEGSFTPKEIC